MSGAADGLDIDTDIVFVDDCDSSGLDAVPCESSKSHGSFKPPDGNRGVDPVLVAPLALEAFHDVPVTSCEDEDGEKDMPS